MCCCAALTRASTVPPRAPAAPTPASASRTCPSWCQWGRAPAADRGVGGGRQRPLWRYASRFLVQTDGTLIVRASPTRWRAPANPPDGVRLKDARVLRAGTGFGGERRGKFRPCRDSRRARRPHGGGRALRERGPAERHRRVPPLAITAGYGRSRSAVETLERATTVGTKADRAEPRSSGTRSARKLCRFNPIERRGCDSQGNHRAPSAATQPGS
jgi:hypothetical protein